MFFFRFLHISLQKVIKKTFTALYSPDKLDALLGYICYISLCILLAAIRQQNYTFPNTTKKSLLALSRKLEKKSRRFGHFFSSKNVDFFRFSTMKYSVINLQQAAASPSRTFHASSPGSWMSLRPVADCIPCSAFPFSLSRLVPIEIKIHIKSYKSVNINILMINFLI